MFVEPQEEVEELFTDDDPLLPMGAADDLVEEKDTKLSQNPKKKLPECALCDKKFTSMTRYLQTHPTVVL